ncbi:gluconokinase [Isoptericola sp. b441]|uniref:Gluconokinase n=1 Tax=Actinotalea lenta TaxID=3064654 RepID=A0ABT9DF44_9CELL|nr:MULTISPECIES: gluconokinase [unclassified Isoptericola]MDO8108087.1 gluconokinase [Isoptericola sp. b441]MDO8120244.1 gluconokinase [Isoptericola sp. b490]
MTRAGAPAHVVVIGVSGAGKTTVARSLADATGRRFADADSFHSSAAKAKMAAGVPLTDDDRWPWLERLRDWMTARAAEGVPTALACSALRRVYRDVLDQADGEVLFVLLDAPRDVLEARVTHRPGHFMPADLLDSQLATLEPPGPGEHVLVLDATRGPEQLARDAVDGLGGPT